MFARASPMIVVRKCPTCIILPMFGWEYSTITVRFPPTLLFPKSFSPAIFENSFWSVPFVSQKFTKPGGAASTFSKNPFGATSAIFAASSFANSSGGFLISFPPEARSRPFGADASRIATFVVKCPKFSFSGTKISACSSPTSRKTFSISRFTLLFALLFLRTPSSPPHPYKLEFIRVWWDTTHCGTLRENARIFFRTARGCVPQIYLGILCQPTRHGEAGAHEYRSFFRSPQSPSQCPQALSCRAPKEAGGSRCGGDSPCPSGAAPSAVQF